MGLKLAVRPTVTVPGVGTASAQDDWSRAKVPHFRERNRFVGTAPAAGTAQAPARGM